MIMNQISSGNISLNGVSSLFRLGGLNTVKSGKTAMSSEFNDIFESRAAGNSGNDGMKSGRTRYLTYREAYERNPGAVSSGAARFGNEKVREKDALRDGDEGKDRKKAVSKDSWAENLLYVFAGMLGLDVGEFQKLLDEAGMTAQSFADPENAQESISKLSQLLGLSGGQQGALEELYRLAAEATGAADGIQAVPDGTAAEASAEAAIAAGAQQPGGVPEAGAGFAYAKAGADGGAAGQGGAAAGNGLAGGIAAEIADKLKARLTILKGELDSGADGVKEEIRLLMQSLQQNQASAAEETPAEQDVSEIAGTEAVDATADSEKETDEASGGEHDAGGAGSYEESNPALNKASAAGETPLENVQIPMGAQEAFAVMQSATADRSGTVPKAAAYSQDLQATPSEIISQVIEKAAVVLTPDKSEMVMDLEPKSLGKLSMKVITENGIVTAEFLAESHQVKQVLEANMQLLKDSLEKQGLGVQNFSVSVRQDSNRGAYGRTFGRNGESRRIQGTAYRTEGITAAAADAIEAGKRVNPYHWGGSTINLTA